MRKNNHHKNKSLSLSTQTVRTLQEGQLDTVAGGATTGVTAGCTLATRCRPCNV